MLELLFLCRSYSSDNILFFEPVAKSFMHTNIYVFCVFLTDFDYLNEQ